jgi:hypothetical protein
MTQALRSDVLDPIWISNRPSFASPRFILPAASDALLPPQWEHPQDQTCDSGGPE